MARALPKDAPVGSFAYEPYTPSKVGVVVAKETYVVQGARSSVTRARFTVKCLDGSTFTATHLNDFSALVEETRRKADRHAATLEELKKIEVD